MHQCPNQIPQNVSTSQLDGTFTGSTHTVPPPSPNTKTRPTITPPQTLHSDVSYQKFRNWRRRFEDYAVMTDLSTLPLSKQHIQLRTCLTPEMLHTPHSSRMFSSPWTSTLKLRQVILMGVRDQDLVQELISIIPTKSLHQVVQHCYACEAARHTATIITSSSKTVCSVSKYKKEKKHKQHNAGTSTPISGTCQNCGKSHDKGQCPANDVTCESFGRKGHFPKTPRCPAKNVTCHSCTKVGHFDRWCRSTKKAGEESVKGGQRQSVGPATQDF